MLWKTLVIATIVLLALLPVRPVPPALASKGPPLTDEDKKRIVYAMYDEYRADFPQVEEITVEAAGRLHHAGRVVFVDTRKPAEMAVSTLPGAITAERFVADPARYAGRTVVAYCTISYRSGKFAERQAARGIRVLNLRGGILAWTLEGGRVVADGREVRRLHVYGTRWDHAPAGYESVMFGLLEKLW